MCNELSKNRFNAWNNQNIRSITIAVLISLHNINGEFRIRLQTWIRLSMWIYRWGSVLDPAWKKNKNSSNIVKSNVSCNIYRSNYSTIMIRIMWTFIWDINWRQKLRVNFTIGVIRIPVVFRGSDPFIESQMVNSILIRIQMSKHNVVFAGIYCAN